MNKWVTDKRERFVHIGFIVNVNELIGGELNERSRK